MPRVSIGHARLANQRIANTTFKQPADVVRWMGAMQAQDYGQAVWGIGKRLHPQHALRHRVEQAVAEGTIIRTWSQRGTIHFVPAEDAGWMVQLGAARMITKDAKRLEQLELDQAIIERSKQIFIALLQDGKPHSRNKLMQALEVQGIKTQGGRGYHILWHIAHDGTIAIGPTEDKEQTFVLMEKWVPNPTKLSSDEALVELARRYFTSHAPTTLQDFAWWAGLPMSEAKKGLEGIRPEMVLERIGKREFWMPTAAPTTHPDTDAMLLLCGFDEYLLGYQKREEVLPNEHVEKVCPGKNGVFFPMIVQDGQVVGIWKRLIKKDQMVITREPFTPFTPEQDAAFEAATQPYGAFMGLKVVYG